MLDLTISTRTPIDAAALAALEAMNLRIVRVLARNRYRLRGETQASIEDVAGLSFVTSATANEAADKVKGGLQRVAEMEIARADIAGAAVPVARDLRVVVALDRDADPAATVALLERDFHVIESSSRRALVEVPADRVSEIAALDGVLYVEEEPDFKTQNNVARVLTKIEPFALNEQLDGAGEIIGVADSGLDTGDVASLLDDFQGRVIDIQASVTKPGMPDGADLNNHGTHVSGSILGDGSLSNGNLRGMAPAAELVMLSMGPDNSTGLSVPVDMISDIFEPAHDLGARLHNNSWGSNQPGQYTSRSEDVDEFMRERPDMLVLIAAGNSGPNAGTVTPPGTAKNALTVGAAESVRPLPATITINPNMQDEDFNPGTPDTNVNLTISNFDQAADDADHIAAFSGRGPVNDGRIAPDLVAPGSWILSCRSSVSTADVGPDGLAHQGNLATFYADDADGVATHAEAVGRGLPGAPIFGAWNQTTPAAPAGSGLTAQDNYFYDSGTSMATPITSGAAALLRQYLRERRGLANPSAALLKALLINGATVPAGQSNLPDNNRGFGWLNLENTIAPSPAGQQTWSDDVNLAVATGDVRSFSLAVDDPSSPLRVTLVWNDAAGAGIQNNLYLRLVAPDNTVIDGDLTAFPSASNNVQRVHVETPLVGTYTIEVHGITVLFGIDALSPEPRQDFALAVINGIGFSPEPVDICQVLDRSGSMGSYGYMEPVRERAKQMVDMLRVQDRCGIVSYNQGATTDAPVEPITASASLATLKAAIDALNAAGLTSIGAGLEAGVDALVAGGDPTHPQALVLLSDGHENRPPWIGGAATDSPPAWYTGAVLDEVLPNLPAGLKVHTVSLGVQSDQVLLQDIALLTGGSFFAIHGPADVGQLHEIYVQLQALVGGEEVIASGSDTVEGQEPGGPNNGGAAAPLAGPALALGVAGIPDGIDRALMLEIAGLQRGRADAVPASRIADSLRVHAIPVDETVEEITFAVSWHDEQRPVVMSLVSPSHSAIHPETTVHHSLLGSSYAFIRVKRPEPGEWTLALRRNARGSADYSWGALAKTPVGIELGLPPVRAGQRGLDLAATLRNREGKLRTLRYTAHAQSPRASTDALLRRHRARLARLQVDIQPDTPNLTEDLFKLALLDLDFRARGAATVFTSRKRRLSLTRTNEYKTRIFTTVPGLHDLRVVAEGKTRAGHAYRRQSILSLRS